MNTTGDRMPDTARQIQDVLTEAGRHWRSLGIPRPERETRLDELRGHLHEATAHGRNISEVVGPDATAFAAQWIHGGRPFPWLSIALRLVGVLGLSIGTIALLGPWGFGLNRFGLLNESFILIGVVAVATLAVDVTRRYRAHLTRQTVTILGIAGVLAAGLVGGALVTAFRGQAVPEGGVVELPILLVLALLACGAGAAALASKIAGTARTRN